MAVSLFACKGAKQVSFERSAAWSQKVSVPGFDNFYKVDEHLYRSEQPDNKGMRELEKSGIRTVLNLRHTRNDHWEARSTKLVTEHVNINTWTISYEELVESLQIILRSEKPVLVHCHHGSDRTGCVVAAYRMVKCGWTKEEAIKEFSEGGFGYHKKWFPNILNLLDSLDIEKLKKDIGEKG